MIYERLVKKLLGYLLDFWRHEKNIPYFLTVTLFLAVLLSINYSIDFESAILKTFKRTHFYFPIVWCYYAMPYYGACAAYAFCYPASSFFRSRRFWMVSSLGLCFLAFNEAFYAHNVVLESFFPAGPTLYFLKKSSNFYVSFLTLIIPITIYWSCADRKMPLYGFSSTNFQWAPYGIMLLCMLPLILLASFQDGFQHSYPVYRDYGAHTDWHTAEIWNVLIFEMGYALDFITVELFFRGFLILALANTMGRAVVVPMATLYCVLHFGKPMGEAISSIFGGAILGIIAYYTRSIYGGIIVHIAIAYSMELAAYCQKL